VAFRIVVASLILVFKNLGSPRHSLDTVFTMATLIIWSWVNHWYKELKETRETLKWFMLLNWKVMNIWITLWVWMLTESSMPESRTLLKAAFPKKRDRQRWPKGELRYHIYPPKRTQSLLPSLSSSLSILFLSPFHFHYYYLFHILDSLPALWAFCLSAITLSLFYFSAALLLLTLALRLSLYCTYLLPITNIHTLSIYTNYWRKANL
jgi:hypothetical protein